MGVLAMAVLEIASSAHVSASLGCCYFVMTLILLLSICNCSAFIALVLRKLVAW